MVNMKNIYRLMISALVLTSCSREVTEPVATAKANDEIKVKSEQRSLWPDNHPEYYNALHSTDRMSILAFYSDENNFKQYSKDTVQSIFVRTSLMGKLTYDLDFLKNNITISEYLLTDIFDKNLPCQACIVRIVKAAESNNSILNSRIPSILKDNKSKLDIYLDNLVEIREDDCNCPGSDTTQVSIGVPNFESTVYTYVE